MTGRTVPDSGGVPGPRPDRRLVPGALLAWAAALIGLTGRVGPIGWIVAGMAAFLAVAVLRAAAWAMERRRTIERRRAMLRGRIGPILVALACAVAGGAAAAAHAERVGSGPVSDAAGTGGSVIAVVDLTGDPRPRTGRVRGSVRVPDAWEIPARIRHLTVAGAQWRVNAPLLLRLDTAPSDPEAALPVRGSRLRVTGRLAPADWTPEFAGVLIAAEPPVELAGPGPIDGVVDALRGGLTASLRDAPEDAAALVAGLAIGDESGQPPELAEAMRISGLSHLTAVSGGNTALVMGAVLLLGRALGVSVGWRVAAAGLALLGYVVLVGPEPSVLRAAAMGAVALLAVTSGTGRRGLSALSAAVVLLVIVAPPLAVALGFALSVAATAGLILVAPRIRAALMAGIPATRWPRLRLALIEAVALTAAAQVATAPLIATLGDGLSLVAIPANVLAAPAVAPVTVLGLLAALSAPVLPPLGWVLGMLAAPGGAWIAGLARAGAGLPAATVPWPGGAVGAALAAGGALLGAVAWRHRAGLVRRVGAPALRIAVVVAIALVVVVAVRPPHRAGWPPPGWILVACDVGQGDAAVIPAGPGAAIVVDAGPDPDAVDRCLADLGVTTVVAVVLTHFHADHVEGLPGVLRGRDVQRVVVSPHREPVDQVARVAGWLGERDLVAEPGAVGEFRRFAPDLAWEIHWPTRIIPVESIPNNASLVVEVTVRGRRILLLGDVEPVAQVAVRTALDVQGHVPAGGFDVVKVPHHGSVHQDPRFAAWAGAAVVLVSVGAGNGYGHPAPETLAAYAAAGSLIRRTDLDGDIAVVVDPAEPDAGLGTVTRK